MAIEADVKIPILLSSIWGQSKTSTRRCRSIWTLQIYIHIGVSLLRFKYSATEDVQDKED